MTEKKGILSPLKIGSIVSKNRFCMGPMAMPFMADDKGGFSGEGINYFVERAKGGFGLIFTGTGLCDCEGNLSTFIPVKDKKHFIASGRMLNEKTGVYGAVVIPQLTVGFGRNSVGEKSPSKLPYFEDPSKYAEEMTKEDIKKKVDSMVESAVVLKQAGFRGMEIHALHWGYLLDEFAMEFMNKREDEYGGSLENRLRFIREIIEGVKQVNGSDFTLTTRLGLKSFIKGFNSPTLDGSGEVGRTLEESIEIAKLLEKYGLDGLSVDAGIYDSFYYAEPPVYAGVGMVVPMAEKVKEAVNIPVLCGSRMPDGNHCDRAISENRIDAVVYSRQSFADPHMPRKYIMGRTSDIRPCIYCNKGCFNKLFLGETPVCSVNPQSSALRDTEIEVAPVKKKVVIAGGGVAGMEFARVAALRGHKVYLHEKTCYLGGKLMAIEKQEFKPEIHALRMWYEKQLRDLKVSVTMHSELNAEKIKKMEPDVAVFSIGGLPVIPQGIYVDNDKVVTAEHAIVNGDEMGRKVVIVGGGLIGCEIAIGLAHGNREITIIEEGKGILGPDGAVPVPNKMMLSDLLKQNDIDIKTGCSITSYEDGRVHINNGGSDEVIEADNLIISVGYVPEKSMAADLNGSGIEVYEVGDCAKTANIGTAINNAFYIAKSL